MPIGIYFLYTANLIKPISFVNPYTMTYLYFTVIRVSFVSPCALLPVSSLSWLHVGCISFLPLYSDAIFPLRSFGAPGANVPRGTHAALCSHRAFISFGSHKAPWARVSRDTRISFCSNDTNFSFFPLLPFWSFRAPWSNFPWLSYSALWSSLPDAAFLSFEAIPARGTRSSRYSGDAGHPWHSRMRILLLKQELTHISSIFTLAQVSRVLRRSETLS